MTIVDEVRSFNRFYTSRIGLLQKHLPGSDLTLAEARVVYELAQEERTAAEIGRLLQMDKAHLSRTIARLRTRGLVTSRVSPDHGRRRLLSLSQGGRETLGLLESAARSQVTAILSPVATERQRRLVAAMQDVKAALGADDGTGREIRLRSLQPGDLGWIIHRQTALYHREYGWDWTYEGLAAGIVSEFVASFDPLGEDAWVAERAGSILGSIFLMKGEQPGVAKLRLLYVEPQARGEGIGRRLVATCIERARKLGYRSLTLWTNDILVSARRIYEQAGFRLVEEAAHRSFGHDLVGQTWTLDLEAELRDG